MIDIKNFKLTSLLMALSALLGLYLGDYQRSSDQLVFINQILICFGIWFFADNYEDQWAIYAFSFFYKVFNLIIAAFGLFSLAKFNYLVLFQELINLIIVYFLFNILNHIYQFYFPDEEYGTTQIEILKNVKTNNGEKVWELSFQSPVLLIFVRHFGCTFCRETVSDISKIEEEIKSKGMNPVFVHMSDPAFGDLFFSKYIESDVSHISDPNKKIYKSFGLKRARLTEFLTMKIWLRFFYAGILKGNGIGKVEGDALQLGGIFLLHEGKILNSNIFEKMSDKFKMPLS